MILYIDFDGVIKDTIPYFDKLMEEKGIDKEDEQSVRKFYSELNWYEFIEKVPFINDAINTINALIDSGIYKEVCILTHVNSYDEGIAKIIHLRNNKCKSNIILVPKQIEKCYQISAEGNILVDDYYKNNIIWEENGGISIRFNKDGKEKEGFITISNLDTLLNPEFINSIAAKNKKRVK